MNLLEIRAVLSQDPILFALVEQIDLEFPLVKDDDIYLSLIRSITDNNYLSKLLKQFMSVF